MKKRHLNKFLWLTLVLLSTYYLYRGPLFLLSLTWIFMTVAAWITIKNGNIVGHRLFVIRSYALALVFIFLRLVGDIPQENLFFFIKSAEIRATTLEWISWIIPLLAIELYFSWIPMLKIKKRKAIPKADKTAYNSSFASAEGDSTQHQQ